MTAGTATAYIGGRRWDADGGVTLPSVNPANGEIIAHVAVGGVGEIDAAVSAARTAQQRWHGLLGRERARLLWTWGDLIERHADELATLDVRDVGKVMADALAEVGGAARAARYWSGAVERLTGHTIPTVPGHLSYTTREPLGVLGVILPWNGPAGTAVARVAPALACGNAVVVKPSEYSPLSALRLAELAVEAGMPAGLVNVVPGDGSTGALLAQHPGTGGVSFTGSVATGRVVAQAAVGHFAKPLMELGGKAPNIVFADADMGAAVRGSTWGIFHNAGQICVASSRLLVQESVVGRVVDALVRQTERIRVGDPMQAGTHIGPIVSQRQYERVIGYIDAGRGEGARLRLGGGVPDGVDPVGLYVSPTVFTDVEPGMRIASEEIFGPVLSVFTFRTEDEAIELANSLDYGLSANVWTTDLGRALAIAGQIEAGNVWVNSARVMDPSLPFGGLKNSGIGNANGYDVLEELTQTKRVSVNYAGAGPAWAGLDEDGTG
jgi:acyl-CoA reductase-like NAD-dependent aldehyde dehydrogenase